jgi:hypothetical protein
MEILFPRIFFFFEFFKRNCNELHAVGFFLHSFFFVGRMNLMIYEIESDTFFCVFFFFVHFKLWVWVDGHKEKQIVGLRIKLKI